MVDDRQFERFEIESSGRLDKKLSEVTSLSRSQIQKLIDDGSVKLSNQTVPEKDRSVTKGDVVTIEKSSDQYPADNKPQPKEGPLDVLYEDEDVLAVNKRSGTLVHPARKTDDSTLVNRLLYHYPSIKDVGPRERPGIAHRLDRGTSGIVLVAKNQKALNNLKEQFHDRLIEKKYRAILHGVMEDETARIKVPIARHHNNPILREANPSGKYAETTITLVGTSDDFSLVYCKPKTGRTHQLRVHSKYIGHRIAGDQKYGSDKINRLMLHAEEVVFTHPSTNQHNTITADPPQEVQSFWNQVKQS